MEKEIAAALAGAVVGAGLGILGAYVVDLRRDQRARAGRSQEASDAAIRERASIASLLLHDARRLETLLRQVFESTHPSRLAQGRPRLYHDALMPQMRAFSAGSLSAIHAFFRQVDHLFSTLESAEEARRSGAQPRERDEYEFRALTGFALQALPAAVSALRAEGGEIIDPHDQWSEVTYPELPHVGEPIFVEAKRRHEISRKSHRPAGA